MSLPPLCPAGGRTGNTKRLSSRMGVTGFSSPGEINMKYSDILPVGIIFFAASPPPRRGERESVSKQNPMKSASCEGGMLMSLQ